MIKKEKIAISIDSNLLEKIDEKVDKINFKSRSNVIESLIREWLKLKDDIWALIIANDNNWNSWDYPLDIPKILIEIDGKTLLEKHLEALKSANIKNIVLALWDKKQQVIDFLTRKKLLNDLVILNFKSNESNSFILEKSIEKLNVNKIIIMLWDNYHHNFNMLDFIHYHNSFNTDFSIVVKTIDVSEWYWNIKLEWNNVVKFVEKPKTKEDISFIVNTWIYLLDLTILDKNNLNWKLEVDFFPDYVENNIVKAYFHNWKWFHMQDQKTLDLLK